MPPYDDPSLLSLAHVYAEARYHASNIPNPPLRKAIAVREALSPMIPNHKFDTPENARLSFVEWMKRGFTDNIFDVLGEYNKANYIEFILTRDVPDHWDEGEIPADYLPTPVQIETLTFPDSFLYCYYLARSLRVPARHLAIGYITNAYYALSKQGQVNSVIRLIQLLETDSVL